MSEGLAGIGLAWVIVGIGLTRMKDTRGIGGLLIAGGAVLLVLGGVVA